MVTVQQARQQLSQQQQVLTQARSQIERAALPAISPAELRARGRTEILQRESRERQLQTAKQRELTKLKPAETQLQQFEKDVQKAEVAIKEQQRQRIAFDQALKVFISKRPEAIFGLSKLEKKFFQQIEAGRQSAVKRSIDEAIEKLKEKGVKEVKPIFKPGTRILVGFEEALKAPRVVPGITLPVITPGERIVFGDPRKFGESFQKATGSDSFTIAVPIRRQDGKLFVQDFNFLFKDGKIVRSTPTGSALITETQFLKVDKRRRDKNPGFTFGDTRIEVPEITPGVTQLPGGTFEKLSTPQKRKFIDQLKDVLSGEAGRQLIGIGGVAARPLIGVGASVIPRITTTDINKFLRGKGGLPGKVLGEFIPETPAETAFLAGFIGLAALPGLTGKIATGVAQGFGAALALSKDLPVETRIAGALVAVAPLIRFLPKPIKGKKFKVPPFSRFLPKGKRGQARFAALEQFFKKEGKKKSDLQKALDEFGDRLSFKRVGKKLEKTSASERIDLIRKSINEIKKTKDPGQRRAQIKGLIELTRVRLGEKPTVQLFNDFLAQEGIFPKKFAQIPKDITATLREPAVFVVPKPPEEIPEVVPGAPAIPEVTPITPPIISITAAAGPLKEINKEIIDQKNKIFAAQTQGQPLDEISALKSGLDTLQKQRTDQITKQGQALKQAQALRTKQILAQRAVSRQKLQKLLGLKKPIPKPFKPFALLKPPVKKKGIFIKVALSKGGFNAFVKSKGKFKKVNINPLTKKKAHDLGSWLTDRSIARTWKIKRIPFKAQKPILKVPANYFTKNIRKFRGKKFKGKIQPIFNLAIEKRKFAIDTPGEKQQLSAARLRARLLKKAFKPITKMKKVKRLIQFK
ncbi:hypothetical protein LCGC14_0466020 [marine sediment metagenome]|uniref:Uncharacterized protein n=1 Tax=marine sediment metagenome TaxID=412755 RepID=A0A0F9VMM6_9ZZZZ